MKKNFLTDFIAVFRGAIPIDICEKIIEKGIQTEEWEPHVWTQYNNENDSLVFSSRDKELLVKGIDDETEKPLNVHIEDCLVTYKETLDRVGIALSVNNFSKARINRYIEGTNMQKHHDNIASLFEKGLGSPTLSIVGVLNNNYKGGDFIMFDTMKIDLKAGDIMVFPSSFLYPHEVTTVTEGERWSLVSWAF
jgi:hypothetical protein